MGTGGVGSGSDQEDPRDFSTALGSLIGWVKTVVPLPEWTEVLVLEKPFPDAPAAYHPVPAEGFGGRFEEILDLGHRDWVNLNLVGVKDGTLVVAVEYATEPLDDGRRFRRDEISVNFSAPCGRNT